MISCLLVFQQAFTSPAVSLEVKGLVNVNFVFKKCLRQIHLSINWPLIFYNTFYGKMCTFCVIYVMNRISLSKNV